MTYVCSGTEEHCNVKVKCPTFKHVYKVKGKGKVVPVLNNTPHHEDVLEV
jgi:hypothetical protein